MRVQAATVHAPFLDAARRTSRTAIGLAARRATVLTALHWIAAHRDTHLPAALGCCLSARVGNTPLGFRRRLPLGASVRVQEALCVHFFRTVPGVVCIKGHAGSQWRAGTSAIIYK
jgi:hypothetical protein